MTPLSDLMAEYRRQLERGIVQEAYRGLMAYLSSLRSHIEARHPDCAVSGSLYLGTMDMTYFSVTPRSLADRRLKVAVVFLHEAFRFEVWLAGANKQVQAAFWKRFRASGWDRYRVVPATRGVDAIVEHVLADSPDFRDLDALTERVERGTFAFIADVEEFLSGHGAG